MSSLHATDASSALFRLLDMGIEPFLVSSSLVGVVAQRLVRRVWRPSGPYEPTAQSSSGTAISAAARTASCGAPAATSAATPACDRLGVYEVLEVTGRSVSCWCRAPARDVRELAMKQGMRTMGQEAMAAVTNDIPRSMK
jgi:type IV pilus assembly protein PilB